MAETTDLQRLVVSMEARYASMERELRKANGVANKQARAIETRFQKMNANVSASFGRLGGFIAGAFSIRAAQQFVDAFTRIQNSLKIAGLQGDELTLIKPAAEMMIVPGSLDVTEGPRFRSIAFDAVQVL